MPIQDSLPKSRITLTYRTNINGQEQEVNLPFRVLVLGDFSHGTSSDFKAIGPDGTTKDVDVDERKIRSVTGGGKQLDKLMADMKIKLALAAPVENAFQGQGAFPVELKIDSMKSFHPDEIVKQVPQLRGLRLLRKLLESIQSNIDNNKTLRTDIEQLYSDPAAIEALRLKLEAKLTPALSESIQSTVDYRTALTQKLTDLETKLAAKPAYATWKTEFAKVDLAPVKQAFADAGTDAAKLTAAKALLTPIQATLTQLETTLKGIYPNEAKGLPALKPDDLKSTVDYHSAMTKLASKLDAKAAADAVLLPKITAFKGSLTPLDPAPLSQELTAAGEDPAKVQDVRTDLDTIQGQLLKVQTDAEALVPDEPFELPEMKKAPTYGNLNLPQDNAGA